MDTVTADALSEDKASEIKPFQAGRGKVNDALTLAEDDLGIAIGVGTDVTVETAFRHPFNTAVIEQWARHLGKAVSARQSAISRTYSADAKAILTPSSP